MTPEQMAALAGQVPDLALAATLTVFVTQAVLAWAPGRLGPVGLPALDGGRVWAVVFIAAMAVVALMSPEARLDRPFLLASLAVTVVAVGGNSAFDRLDAMRASRGAGGGPSPGPSPAREGD